MMKTKIGFVTNSSTTVYLIVTGHIKGKHDIHQFIHKFVKNLKLDFSNVYYIDGDEKVHLEYYNNITRFHFHLDIPFHIAINDVVRQLNIFLVMNGYSGKVDSCSVDGEYAG